MKLFIIGMPGSGKSYFGRKLSKTLHLKFVDLDEAIEKESEKKIKDIISKEGEDTFRLLEKGVLRSFDQSNQILISCGGGTPIYHDNIKWMKNQGIIIWLNTNLEKISERISKNLTRRPMFLGLNQQEIDLKIRDLYEKRRKIYQQADIIVESEKNGSILLSVVIQQVMEHSRRFKS